MFHVRKVICSMTLQNRNQQANFFYLHQMITIIQRVSEASVTIHGIVKSKISHGFLILVGIEETDNDEDIQWLASKIVNLRIFNDADGVMNINIKDIHGEIIVVSQFTLHASTKKGNRPSYLRAAKPEVAIPLYERFVAVLSGVLEKPVQTGEFGADMKVALINDGPVTIIIDSKNKA
jgi:D-tyrosyl-tRNA(Tyr) deacylase